jgi:hypothetical protein
VHHTPLPLSAGLLSLFRDSSPIAFVRLAPGGRYIGSRTFRTCRFRVLWVWDALLQLAAPFVIEPRSPGIVASDTARPIR